MEECPRCKESHPYVSGLVPGTQYVTFCASCGYKGPEGYTRQQAKEKWNNHCKDYMILKLQAEIKRINRILKIPFCVETDYESLTEAYNKNNK